MLDPGTICALVGVTVAAVDHFKAIMGFVRPSSGEVALRHGGRSGDQENLVAYVPQSEEVDRNFPALVETVVMMGRYGP